MLKRSAAFSAWPSRGLVVIVSDDGQPERSWLNLAPGGALVDMGPGKFLVNRQTLMRLAYR